MGTYMVTYLVRTTIEAESEAEVINFFDQEYHEEMYPEFLEIKSIVEE